jgi:bacillolysin
MREPDRKVIFGEVSIMKRFFCLIFCVLLVVSFLESAYVGKVYFKQQPGEQRSHVFKVPKSFSDSWSLRQREIGKANIMQPAEKEQSVALEEQLSLLQAYFESEEQKGNLRIRLVQDDPVAMMEHHRYTQYYKDLEVFGGEIIQHFKSGKLVGINGEYYEIEDFATAPLITKDMAAGLFRADLGKFSLVENLAKSKLIIYPVKDGDYHVAYWIILNGGPGYSMTGIIDAKTGKVLMKYSNIYTEDLTIGIGYGQHGEKYKFPTTFQNNKYWLKDLKQVRPANQYTLDFRTFDGRYYYVASDSDNNWDYDGALVSAHTFLGLTYDYYYLVLGRKGINSNNMDVVSTVHWPDPGKRDNAFWDGNEQAIYFGEPGLLNMQSAGSLDLVAHEYSHGVSSSEYNVYYYSEPGALNESFSDIMGTAVEFYWQEPGNGLLKADWVIGEDSKLFFSKTGCRSLEDPNSNSQLKNAGYPPSYWYPDPCHLSQEVPFLYYSGSLVDNGGVHVNSTIYSHAYYLLANGGTNKISGKSVAAIGIDKATKIFYLTWTFYVGLATNFYYVKDQLLMAARDLYGSSSNEYAQTLKAMEAIGWVAK